MERLPLRLALAEQTRVPEYAVVGGGPFSYHQIEILSLPLRLQWVSSEISTGAAIPAATRRTQRQWQP